MILVRTGVIEMGLKSACCVGTATLETGRIQACFHCRGTMEVARERLKRWDRGYQNMVMLASASYSLNSSFKIEYNRLVMSDKVYQVYFYSVNCVTLFLILVVVVLCVLGVL